MVFNRVNIETVIRVRILKNFVFLYMYAYSIVHDNILLVTFSESETKIKKPQLNGITSNFHSRALIFIVVL